MGSFQQNVSRGFCALGLEATLGQHSTQTAPGCGAHLPGPQAPSAPSGSDGAALGFAEVPTVLEKRGFEQSPPSGIVFTFTQKTIVFGYEMTCGNIGRSRGYVVPASRPLLCAWGSEALPEGWPPAAGAGGAPAPRWPPTPRLPDLGARDGPLLSLRPKVQLLSEIWGFLAAVGKPLLVFLN